MNTVARQPRAEQSLIAEVAVYTVRNPAEYPAIWNEALDRVMESPYILGGVQLQSLKDRKLFADVYFWTDLDEARAIARSVEKDAEYADFQNSFEELRLFTHFETTSAVDALNSYLVEGAVVEIAAYTAKDAALRDRLQPAVYDRLSQEEEVLGAISMTPIDPADGFVDFLAWQSMDAAEAIAGKLMQDADTKPFFDNAETMKVFEFFTVFGQKGLK